MRPHEFAPELKYAQKRKPFKVQARTERSKRGCPYLVVHCTSALVSFVQAKGGLTVHVYLTWKSGSEFERIFGEPSNEYLGRFPREVAKRFIRAYAQSHKVGRSLANAQILNGGL